MKTIEINLYSFDELKPEVQKKVLDNLRDINTDHYWWDGEYEAFTILCKLIGIEVEDIHFVLSYSQGDGASFKASIDLPELLKAIESQAWKKEFPTLDLDFYPITTNMKRISKLIQSGLVLD